MPRKNRPDFDLVGLETATLDELAQAYATAQTALDDAKDTVRSARVHATRAERRLRVRAGQIRDQAHDHGKGQPQ